jgi:23S rRNA pseudouridine1911/1915/1917 synthase
MNIKDLIVYEDKYLVIINKPRNLLSQFDGNKDNESLDVLLSNYLGKQAMLINRLDKDTSGLIVFAKDNKSATELANIINDHSIVEKHYLTLVNGVVSEDGVVDAPLRKSYERKKMVVAPLKSGAKSATTKYFVKEKYQNYTLLDVQLVTGRTHQIRVHMSAIGHPVEGDPLYYGKFYNRIYKNGQLLTAYKLHLTHPRTGKEMEFEIDLPDYFKEVLNNLEK